ncbi:hypothetical protein ACSLBF_09575 [Pseudoalteromonas sp. T1lg65]|uniref:hypothetical protein n=1 Tax=Pseudoalteromonas sp. T1lg65 TaxID=2077101 RepID=UPI003F78F84D
MKRSIINIAIVTTALTALTLSADAEARKGKKGPRKAPEVIFNKLDADQSGTLTLDELQANNSTKAQKKLERTDSDSSGEIELTEYLAKQRHSRDLSDLAVEIVECVQQTKDAGESSNIVVPSIDKFASPEQKFAQLDSDSNGGISVVEITNSLAARHAEGFSAMDSDNSNDVTLNEFIQHGEAKHATKQAVKACIDSLVNAVESI